MYALQLKPNFICFFFSKLAMQMRNILANYAQWVLVLFITIPGWDWKSKHFILRSLPYKYLQCIGEGIKTLIIWHSFFSFSLLFLFSVFSVFSAEMTLIWQSVFFFSFQKVVLTFLFGFIAMSQTFSDHAPSIRKKSDSG